MSYLFLDANGSVVSANSSILFGDVQTPIVNVGSIMSGVSTTPQPASISGVGLFNTNHIGNGSIQTVWKSPSIVGTYAEDTAYTAGDKGLFVLGMRNDTMASITSDDSDYSGHAVGPAGEQIAVNAPFTRWIQAQTSIMYGASVQAIAPQGTSVFTYVTGVQVVNESPNNVIVKFTGGLGSVLGWTTAPANGGSNIMYVNALKTGANSGFAVSISGVGSVYLSAQGFTAKI